MEDKQTEQIIKAAANVLMDTVLELIQNDSHMWSLRPCSTCAAITSIVGRPFGCYEYQRRKKETNS